MNLMNDTSNFVSGAKSQILNKLPELIISALTLVAGLAWNEAIQDVINYYLPKDNESNVWYRILYAFILTIVIVFIIYFVVVLGNKAKETFGVNTN